MAIDRGAPIHGTGWTIGDIVDAAAEGGGSPQAGQPTRFLTLTYHHPGNEDGNSVSATTGIPIPDSASPVGIWSFVFQLRVVESNTPNHYGFVDTLSLIAAGVGTTVLSYLTADNDGAGSAYPPSLWPWSNQTMYEDPQFSFGIFTKNGGQLYALIHGLSTNTPTDWTINVQLTPIAP